MEKLLEDLKRDIKKKKEHKKILKAKDIPPEHLISFYKQLSSESPHLLGEHNEIFTLIEEISQTHFKNQNDLSKNVILFECHDLKPMAYIQLKTRQDFKKAHGVFLKIGVLEQYQRQGSAKRLYQAALDELNKNIFIVYASCRSDNMGALQFLHKIGFQQIAFLEKDLKFNEQYFDGILLRSFLKNGK